MILELELELVLQLKKLPEMEVEKKISSIFSYFFQIVEHLILTSIDFGCAG